MKRVIKAEDAIDARGVRNLKKDLIEAFKETYAKDLTPNDTVDLLLQNHSLDEVRYIIAAMVNCKGEWDARIWDYVYDWAKDIAPDEDTLRKYGVYYCDEIHPVYMNQLATAIMKR